MAYYEIVSNQQNVKAEDWPLKSTVLDAEASQGQWVEQDSNKDAIVANDNTFTAVTHQQGVVRPIWSGKEAPDAQELSQVTTVYGAHEALSDGYHVDPTGLTPARAAWAVKQPIVIVDGLPAPFLDGTDKDYSIVGHVKELADADSRIRFHVL